jgi:Reverse transcriptase (RNA-dependent DNA polymerase).
MKRLIDLTNEEARLYFLKGSSYFNADMPQYIDFQPVINNVANLIKCEPYVDFNRKPNPSELEKVNHTFLSNKDGKFAWRPLELIHPVIYTSLVNLICNSTNWGSITSRLSEFQGGIVECCSIPVVPEDHEKDAGLQVENWWMNVEQKSLCYSLEFSHLLHTDVTDCYGSLYTHSISWAIHTIEIAKEKKNDHSLLGNNIDFHIRAGRYGQTNGISQGSVLMDFLAEIVLGYLDEKINETLIRTFDRNDIRILRYRDNYRIFSNSDETCEQVLRVISETLSKVGMRLGA